jgi:hypothetical protein
LLSMSRENARLNAQIAQHARHYESMLRILSEPSPATVPAAQALAQTWLSQAREPGLDASQRVEQVHRTNQSELVVLEEQLATRVHEVNELRARLAESERAAGELRAHLDALSQYNAVLRDRVAGTPVDNEAVARAAGEGRRLAEAWLERRKREQHESEAKDSARV